jgi:uncharacterized SAM-binding protein YcdF (DUF218 family)
LATIALPLCAAAYLPGSIYVYSFVADPLPAEAAIVLGAAVWDQRPSPVFEERIKHAIDLYQAGKIRAIIFTGGLGPGDAMTEAGAARNYALQKGVAAQDIFVDTLSTTTYENLSEAKIIADSEHLKRVLVISDPLHMKRALTIARDIGMDAYPSPTPTSRYTGLRTQLVFLARETYFYATYLLRRLFAMSTGMARN